MLAVKDLMQTDVVTVTTDTSARHLARTLADEEISGVPVLDSSGRLVGVVSSTDLVRLAADDAGFQRHPPDVGVDPITDPETDDDTAEAKADPFGFFLPEDSPFEGSRFPEQWFESEFDAVAVADIMTPVTFSVTPDTPVSELCQFLVGGRIHRAVVAEGKALVGIVTSADVLRAIADGRIGG